MFRKKKERKKEEKTMGKIEYEEDTEKEKEEEKAEYMKKVALCYSDGTLVEERIIFSESELKAILEIPSDVTEEEDGTLVIRRK